MREAKVLSVVFVALLATLLPLDVRKTRTEVLPTSHGKFSQLSEKTYQTDYMEVTERTYIVKDCKYFSEAKRFIYMHESGCRTDAINHLGCYGLGQDCNNQLSTQCPNWKTDFNCQDKYWEAYMKRRYGSWEKARAFWIARVKIDGRDVGSWW